MAQVVLCPTRRGPLATRPTPYEHSRYSQIHARPSVVLWIGKLLVLSRDFLKELEIERFLEETVVVVVVQEGQLD